MADEFKEGIEELSDEQLASNLRGVVIDLDESRRKSRWKVAGIICLILCMFSGWTYFYLSKSDAEILEERLNNHMAVLAMLRQARVQIQNSAATTEEIEGGIRLAIQVTHTPLRQGMMPQSPFIRERHLAMMEALEGLLRLVIEKRVDPLDPNTSYADLLMALGQERLEYFENGVLERVPLLEGSWVLRQIHEERRNRSYVDEREIIHLEKQLAQLESAQEMNVTSAAYTLGRWYRFYNDIESSERCFQIGRRYVEGYEFEGEFQSGQRPANLNRFWDAYVGCLESLAETRFQSKHYREARSYLSRIFQTPIQGNPFQQRYELTRASPYRSHRIRTLSADIDILKRAIASPLLIPSFPHFAGGQGQIDISDLRQRLKRLPTEADHSAAGLLWASLSDQGQRFVSENDSSDAATTSLETEVVDILNLFVADPEFHRQVVFDKEELSIRGKELWEKAKEHVLSPIESSFLNREIIDRTLGRSVIHPYVLSDGTRLSDALTTEQQEAYLRKAEQFVNNPKTPADLRSSYDHQLKLIRQGQSQPNIHDFDTLIGHQQASQQDIINQSKQNIEIQKRVLQQLQKQIQELESAQNIDLARLGRIQQKESRCRELLADAETARDEAQNELDRLVKSRHWVVSGLHQQLGVLEEELAYLNSHQDHAPRSAVENQEVLLGQLEDQMALRQQYLNLLKGLRATGGEREIERIRIEKSRLEGVIEVLKESISQETGDRRELLQAELAEHEAARHALLEEFNSLYSPLRSIVNDISKKEEEIWQAELQLRETQEEILALIGNKQRPGLIEDSSQRLAELLLRKSQDAIHAPLYDSEIRRLNKEVSEAHARLNVLLQKETQYRVMLEAFYPHFFRNELLFTQGGKLAPLQKHLKQQERLMSQYRKLWQVGELQEDIRLQHSIILENLQRIDTELADERKFSSEKTENLTRHMQALLEAKKRLTHNTHLLRQLAKGEAIQSSLRQISGKGYLIDSVEMFQLEHSMGLNISEYRKAFDERNAILEQLRVLLDEQQMLQQEKIAAARQRDQKKIDEIIPLVSEKDGLIDILTRKELAINQRLRNLAADYKSRLNKVHEYQEKIRPQMARIDLHLQELNQEIIANERQVEELITEVFTTADELKKTVTTLTVEDLQNLDEIIQVQENELQRLASLRDLKKHENYYKSKALYWIGKSFYEESRLPSFEALVASSSIPDSMIRDHERHAKLRYEEFDPIIQRSEHEIISQAPPKDEDMVTFQFWVDSLEQNALRIFQHDLPQHIPPEVFSEDRQLAQGDGWLRDSQVYVARSRFQMGQIYLKRGLRYIRNTATPVQKNERAKKELDQAVTAFINFLDFTRPFTYQSGMNLSETRMGAQEFPVRRRYPIYLDDEAGVYLGICSSLKGDHQQAIAHYRNLLKTMIAREGQSKTLKEASTPPIGQVDPVLAENLTFTANLYPVYASLLAQTPQAHEVLYRIGRAYHHLAEEQHRLDVEHSYLPSESTKNFREHFESYSLRALAYYSQLILTHSYSPYHKAARLQRALLNKRNGYYQNAQDDLIAILGAADDLGGSLDPADLNSKGDLPGELNPGYSLISFELGKLHLENHNYDAAALAFMQAKEGDPDNIVVLQAKIAYAEALIKAKEWLMADLLLTELIRESYSAPAPHAHLYPPQLWIQLSQVKQSMGNLTAAKETLQDLFRQGPQDIADDEGELDLSNRYTIIMLEQEHRDAIRPIAEAALAYANICLRQRNWNQAAQYFKNAETLFHKVPWQHDRLLRSRRQSDYLAYKREQLLECRWGQLRTKAQELMHSSLGDYRKEFNQLAFVAANPLKPLELIQHIADTLENVEDNREAFLELAAELDAFHLREAENLPEALEAARIIQQRDIDRQLGRPEAIRYEALARMRETLAANRGSQIPLNADRIANIFSKNSVEYGLLNDFALVFSSQIDLADDDRDRMLPGYSNIDNLKTIANANVRLKDFPDAFTQWIELEMQATGLDDLFIPVSAESGILEQVDLYRVSILSHVNDSDSYDRIAELADRYLKKPEAVPNRVSNPETLWQIIEIAAMSAQHVLDWDRVAAYNRFLLDPQQQGFFVQEDQGDRYRAELGLAQALVEISRKTYSDLIFIQNEEEQILAQQQAEKQLAEARQRLEKLINTTDSGGSAITTRIRAKELLKQMGA